MHSVHINIRRFCVILVGLVFYISGMFKLMDPVGTGLIVKEYLKFFHLSGLAPAAKAFGVLLALAETQCGVYMICGLARRLMSYVVLVMVSCFTAITLILLIFNPSMDCGCFGEAIHLSHWQSFVKNIILLAVAIVGFVPIRSGQRPRRAKIIIGNVVSVLVVSFAINSVRELPVVDFTEYAPGSEDFSLVYSSAGGEYTASVEPEGKVFIVSVYDPERFSWEEWEKVSILFSDALVAGMEPLLLTTDVSGVPDDLTDYAYEADYKQLITLNRANGGSTYICDGMIVDKWTRRAPCTSEEMAALVAGNPIEAAVNGVIRGRIFLEALLLGSVVAMLLL